MLSATLGMLAMVPVVFAVVGWAMVSRPQTRLAGSPNQQVALSIPTRREDSRAMANQALGFTVM